jgi:hypothetical protein
MLKIRAEDKVITSKTWIELIRNENWRKTNCMNSSFKTRVESCGWRNDQWNNLSCEEKHTYMHTYRPRPQIRKTKKNARPVLKKGNPIRQ